jgi:hypothetical protein
MKMYSTLTNLTCSSCSPTAEAKSDDTTHDTSSIFQEIYFTHNHDTAVPGESKTIVIE